MAKPERSRFRNYVTYCLLRLFAGIVDRINEGDIGGANEVGSGAGAAKPRRPSRADLIQPAEPPQGFDGTLLVSRVRARFLPATARPERSQHDPERFSPQPPAGCAARLSRAGFAYTLD
jgi:hypothetical protein